jgi:hypothetical protein
MYARRRRVTVLVFLVLAAVVLLVGLVMRNHSSADRADAPTVMPVASALPAAGDPAPIETTVGAPQSTETAGVHSQPTETVGGGPGPAGSAPPGSAMLPDAVDETRAQSPAAAAGAFAFVAGYGPVLGSAGTLRRFKVAVERPLGYGDGGDFADEVDRILGDPRSWIAGRRFRLQRVPSSAAAEFTIYLASPGTSEKMCAGGGLRTGGFTSCRLPGQVIINSERWAEAVPGYGAPLAVYRAYAINHEVGHQFGHGHEACAGNGELAPVMMQQTYGLKGCVAYAWPYLDGKRYAGNPVA